MIDIRNVSYSYDSICALRDISLTINNGEAVAVMGSNGSGKSTLLKLINGIVLPDSGSYLFDGSAITEKSLRDNLFAKSFHQKIGYLFQNSDVQLFCARVYDEIAFAPRQMDLPEAEVDKRVADCANLLGITHLIDRQPYHLSGGEKKKVALASVLATNPDLLVLDEPMNGLDPRTQRWFVEMLVNLNRAGKTLLISTHNIELVEEISHRAILFDENHSIVADDSTEKILSDVELLKRVNLVDEYYHRHSDGKHVHHHTHYY
jgi:cobalt/nickel transport system ATP-binding protein